MYSLFFFGLGDLPDELIEVPLELFEEFLAYHSKNSQTDGPITVLGASKGAELTLNLATQYSQIDNVVLYAPSAYNFFSLDQANMNKSSWSYEGLSVPYLSNRNGNWQETVKMIGGFIFYYPVKYVSVYDSVIDGTEKTDLERARIKIENFEGNGLIFIGGDDLMWPTQSMTNVMEEYTEQMEVHFFPEAGHLFPMDRYMGTSGALIAFGGNKNINKQALEESNKILFERLSQWHGNNE